jgi:hypothetical protein
MLITLKTKEETKTAQFAATKLIDCTQQKPERYISNVHLKTIDYLNIALQQICVKDFI